MTAAKRNRSATPIGKKRGLSIQAARAIAKKYSLDQIVIWTANEQARERIVFFANNEARAMRCAELAATYARACGWPDKSCDFETSYLRRLKRRIDELETALAQIVDGCSDPVELARTAGKFPIEDEVDQHIAADRDAADNRANGEWIFFPLGKLNQRQRVEWERACTELFYNVLTPEQLGADSVKDLAYWTWQKLRSLDFGNVAGEIETAIAHAVRKFSSFPTKRGPKPKA